MKTYDCHEREFFLQAYHSAHLQYTEVLCLPVIEFSYASPFLPALEHGKHAILIDPRHPLENQVKAVFAITREERGSLREGVKTYFTQYLSPNGVIGRIESQRPKVIRLQAEDHSVDILTGKKKAPAYDGRMSFL